MKTPNARLQAPEKLQATNTKAVTPLGVFLELGGLVFRAQGAPHASL
jgi:hypothetical protein